MRGFYAVVLTVLVMVAVSSCVTPDRSGWSGVGAAPGAANQLEAAYLDTLDALLPGMGHETLVEREESQQTFEKICHLAGAPGNGARRKALSKAIMARVGPQTAKPARVWLLRKIEPLGRGEVVRGLAVLLDDEDPQSRELARRALQNNPSRRAADALRAALKAAEDPTWRIALINALAARGDRSSVSIILPLVYARERDVTVAAVSALADLGGSRAVSRLHALRRGEDALLRERAADALLRVADLLLAKGKRSRAAAIYHDMYQSSANVGDRIAAFRGLAASEGEKALPLLLEVISGEDDPQMQCLAARFAQDIAGRKVTLRLAAELDSATPETQVLLLDVLGGRSDVAARDAVVAAVESPVQEVRVAALQALGRLGDESLVLLLAEAASRSKGEEREAARTSLTRMRGEDVDDVILTRMDSAPRPVRVELIKALQARWVAVSVPKLFSAARDPDESVRVAALEALGTLAGEADLATLVRVLVDAEGDEVREAAEDAVVETSRRIDTSERRAAPVLAALPAAAPPIEASLIRVLGRIEGEDALAAVRAACEDTDEKVRDAAVRALAQWSEPTVMDDLFAIAQDGESETHRILALRGYVRLVRLPSDRDASTTLDLLERAMLAAADDTETKKQVLAALGDVMLPDALDYTLSFLEDTELEAEAGAAVLEIAKGISAEHYDDAVAAIEQVRTGGATAEDLIDEALEFVEEHQGYCVRWLFSGPYEEEGKEGPDHLDLVFPPEEPDAQDVMWEPLAVTDPENPWAFDLIGDTEATNCCAYVKTKVWSDGQQVVQLHIGSDDGVKVWLNGEVVHRHEVSRGLECGEDTVDGTLAQGWNDLLLKITQGGGDWGVCCGIKAADGGNIDGLKFEAE